MSQKSAGDRRLIPATLADPTVWNVRRSPGSSDDALKKIIIDKVIRLFERDFFSISKGKLGFSPIEIGYKHVSLESFVVWFLANLHYENTEIMVYWY